MSKKIIYDLLPIKFCNIHRMNPCNSVNWMVWKYGWMANSAISSPVSYLSIGWMAEIHPVCILINRVVDLLPFRFPKETLFGLIFWLYRWFYNSSYIIQKLSKIVAFLDIKALSSLSFHDKRRSIHNITICEDNFC